MKDIKSPIQVKPGSPLFLVKLAGDLLRVHNDFLKKVDEFIRESKELKSEAKRIKELPQGEPGKPGKAGYTPVKGVDYFDGAPGKDASEIDLQTVAELAAGLIMKPKDGKDAEEVPIDMIVSLAIEKIKEEDSLGINETFKRMDNNIASYRNQLAGKVYGKDTWARGGGGSSTSSGKSVATQYLLTAVQAGSDTTIDLTQLTNWATFDQLICVYRNNLPQTSGVGYDFTRSGSTVTVFNSAAEDIYTITYSYV